MPAGARGEGVREAMAAGAGAGPGLVTMTRRGHNYLESWVPREDLVSASSSLAIAEPAQPFDS